MFTPTRKGFGLSVVIVEERSDTSISMIDVFEERSHAVARHRGFKFFSIFF